MQGAAFGVVDGVGNVPGFEMVDRAIDTVWSDGRLSWLSDGDEDLAWLRGVTICDPPLRENIEGNGGKRGSDLSLRPVLGASKSAESRNLCWCVLVMENRSVVWMVDVIAGHGNNRGRSEPC